MTTPSGLQYVEVQAGHGEQPQPGSVVAVHYRGMLADGSVFDSSYERGSRSAFRSASGWSFPVGMRGSG